MILDVRMPEALGDEVCRADQAGRRLGLPAGHPGHRLRGARTRAMRALDSDADDLLISPVNRLELLARVRSLLRLQLYHQDLVRPRERRSSRSRRRSRPRTRTRAATASASASSRSRLAREIGEDEEFVRADAHRRAAPRHRQGGDPAERCSTSPERLDRGGVRRRSWPTRWSAGRSASRLRSAQPVLD